METIGVVYLCRANEKKELFSNFIDSYKTFPADRDHELIIIFKGFQDHPASYLNEIQEMFEGLEYQAVYLPDEGFDIGAYLATAKIVTYDYLLFFNTYTTIVGKGWLGYLCQAINHDDVGLVGTSASYESVFSPLSLTYRFSDLYFKGESEEDPHIFDYYQSLATGIDPNHNSFKRIRRLIKFRIKHFFKKLFRRKDLDTLVSKRIVYEKELYGRFYNPYIRSNGFMISRELLLSLFGDYIVQTKEDACEFESGLKSLTRRIWALGMKTLLVGKNGIAYDIEDWPKSNTFRLGDQENLLTNDNQTRRYQSASQQEKLIYTWISWSNAVIRSKIGAPHLGFIFNTTPLTDMLVDKRE